MQPLHRQQHQLRDLQRLQALDTDRDGRISRVEVQQALDSNQDGKLSKAELKAAGFRHAGLQHQLQQSYRQGAAQPELPLFDTSSLENQAQALAQGLQTTEAQLQQDLNRLLEGFNQSTLNSFDSNFDNQLSLAEVQQLSRADLQKAGELFGVEKQTLDKIWQKLQLLVQLKQGQPAASVLRSQPTGSDFASGMRYLDDPSEMALKAAAGKSLATARQELAPAEQQVPALRPLIQQLQKLKQLTPQNLVLLKQFIDQHPQQAQPSLELLNKWLNQPPSQGAAISARERPAFVAALLKDLAFPDDIDQGEKGTCAATGIQMELARRDPQQYLKFATTLAEGQAYRLLDTPAGEVRRIYPNTSYRQDKADTRSLSARLLQDSLMDTGHMAGENETFALINGQVKAYDSRMSVDSAQGLDESEVLKNAAKRYPELKQQSPEVLARLGDGLSEAEIEYLGQGFFGNHWHDAAAAYHESQVVPNPEKPAETITVKRVARPEALFARIDAALAQGQTLTIGSEDHVMLLTGKTERAGKAVYVVSSWSGRYLMTPEALQQRLTNVFSAGLPEAP